MPETRGFHPRVVEGSVEHVEAHSAESLRQFLRIVHSSVESSEPGSQAIDTESEQQLEKQVMVALEECEVPIEDRQEMFKYLAILREQDHPSYLHSLEVGLLNRAIAHHEGQDQQEALLTGLLHDVGKSFVPQATLKRTVGWSEEDKARMKDHVMDGVEFLGQAEWLEKYSHVLNTITLHHQFQADPNLTTLPESITALSEEERAAVEAKARLLSLADVYQALHRPNDRFAGQKVYDTLLKLKPNEHETIEELYRAGIFTMDGEIERKTA